MNNKPIPSDKEAEDLIAEATKLLQAHYAPKKHHVASVLKAASGKKYYGLHLDSAGFDACAEPSAISSACIADDRDLSLVVAVMKTDDGNVEVTNPCGNCLQCFLVFAPNIEVIARTPKGIRRLRVSDLLPYPYG